MANLPTQPFPLQADPQEMPLATWCIASSGRKEMCSTTPKPSQGGTVLIAFARRIPNALEKALLVPARAARQEVQWRRRRSCPPGMPPRRPTASRMQHKEFAAQQLSQMRGWFPLPNHSVNPREFSFN